MQATSHYSWENLLLWILSNVDLQLDGRPMRKLRLRWLRSNGQSFQDGRKVPVYLRSPIKYVTTLTLITCVYFHNFPACLIDLHNCCSGKKNQFFYVASIRVVELFKNRCLYKTALFTIDLVFLFWGIKTLREFIRGSEA